jgi:hypothetical protein
MELPAALDLPFELLLEVPPVVDLGRLVDEDQLLDLEPPLDEARRELRYEPCRGECLGVERPGNAPPQLEDAVHVRLGPERRDYQ